MRADELREGAGVFLLDGGVVRTRAPGVSPCDEISRSIWNPDPLLVESDEDQERCKHVSIEPNPTVDARVLAKRRRARQDYARHRDSYIRRARENRARRRAERAAADGPDDAVALTIFENVVLIPLSEYPDDGVRFIGTRSVVAAP